MSLLNAFSILLLGHNCSLVPLLVDVLLPTTLIPDELQLFLQNCKGFLEGFILFAKILHHEIVFFLLACQNASLQASQQVVHIVDPSLFNLAYGFGPITIFEFSGIFNGYFEILKILLEQKNDLLSGGYFAKGRLVLNLRHFKDLKVKAQ